MPAQSKQLESVTFDGVPLGMNVALEPHEIKDEEAAYLQDALVFKPGLLISRGQVAPVNGVNVFTNRITGLVQTFDSGGNVRIGAMTGTNAAAYLSVLSDDYSSATDVPWTGTLPSSPYYILDSKPTNSSSTLIGTSEQYEADSAAQAIGLWKGGTKANYTTGTVTVTRGSTSVTGSGTAWSTNASRGMYMFDGSGQLVGVVKTVDSNTAITLEEPALVAISAAAYSLKSVRGINPRVRKGRITTTTATATVSGQNTKFSDMGMGTGTWDVFRARDMTFVGTVTSIQNNTNLTFTANSAVAMDKELFVGIQRNGDYSLSTQASTRKPGFLSASYAERQFYANRAGGNGDQVDRLWFSEIGDPEALDLSAEDGDFLRVTTGSARAVNTPIKALASTYNALLILKENEAFGLFGNTPAQFELKKLGDEGCLSGMSVASYEGGAIWAGREGIYHFDGTEINNIGEDNLGDEWKTCVKSFNPQTHRMWGFIHRDHYILHVERVTPGASVTKGVTGSTPTELTVVIYLPMLALSMFTNVCARGATTLPAQTGHNTWWAINGTETAGTQTAGKTAIGASGAECAGDTKVANQITLSVPATVTKLTARLSGLGSGTGNQKLKGMIYSDSSGSPGTLLGTTNEVTVLDGQAAGWVDLTFASSVSLAAGTYWLALIFDASGSQTIIRYYDAGSPSYWNADTYSDGPATPFGSPTGLSQLFSIYATYTETPRGWICSADALFDDQDRDQIICEDQPSAGPDFYIESKKYSLGEHMQKKLWKQITLNYLAAGSTLSLDTVVGLNNLGATSGSTFPASVYTWDTLSSTFLTWDDLAEAFATWDDVLDSVFLPKRIKFLKRSTHLSFRLYATDASALTEVRLGPWALGFKWQRPGRI